MNRLPSSSSADSAKQGVTGRAKFTHSKRPKLNPNPNPKPDAGILKREVIKASKEDVMVILEGMIDHTARTGLYPPYDIHDFHASIKDSLRVHLPKRKLKAKIRSLRSSYKKGVLSQCYDPEIYRLCYQIWGGPEKFNHDSFRVAQMRLYLERVRLAQQQIKRLLELI